MGGADLFRFASSSMIMDAVEGSLVLSRVPKTNFRWGRRSSGVSGITETDVDSATAGERSSDSGLGVPEDGVVRGKGDSWDGGWFFFF